MHEEQIKEKIRQFILRYSRAASLGDEENIFERGYVNSLFAMQLVMFLEKEFDFVVDNADLSFEQFSTVRSLTNLILSKKVATR